MGKRGIIITACCVALLVAGGLVARKYWIYIPGMLSEWRDPIAPNQPVTWQQGPQTADTAPDKRPPNIVVILADDLGFNDITFYGGGVAGGTVPTPNIDSIGKAGIHFPNAYAGNATCSPSRAAILTGRYATRFGFEFTSAPIQFQRLVATWTDRGIYREELEAQTPPIEEMGVPPEEITVAELLKEKGYHSLLLGKWHLGGGAQTNPNAQGFDEYLGFLPGAAMFLPEGDPDVVNSKQDFDPIDVFLWANLPYAISYNGSQRFEPGGYMTEYLADEAVKAIDANRNRPFFMYLSFNAPHTPLQALKSDYDALAHIENHTLRTYAGMIRSLDRSIGRVLQALKDQGLEDNTLVIFTSDNGGAHYVGLNDLNHPYRGWKATMFEGGIHVPFFIKWPAKIEAGSVYDKPVAHVDVFATAAAAAGVTPPQDRLIDGVDLVSYAQGASDGRPHESLFWRSGQYSAMRLGDWKLQLSEIPEHTERLYDLSADPTEQTNLAANRPDKLAELKQRWAEINAQQSKPLWPSLLSGPIPVDRPLGPDGPGDGEIVYWDN